MPGSLHLLPLTSKQRFRWSGELHFVQRETKDGPYACLLGNLRTCKHGWDFVVVLMG